MTSSDGLSLYKFLQHSGLAWSAGHAAALIMEQLVTVNGRVVLGTRRLVQVDDVVAVVGDVRTVVVGDGVSVGN